jgi:hypothetical protein
MFPEENNIWQGLGVDSMTSLTSTPQKEFKTTKSL